MFWLSEPKRWEIVNRIPKVNYKTTSFVRKVSIKV
jgi:hypothetical protein